MNSSSAAREAVDVTHRTLVTTTIRRTLEWETEVMTNRFAAMLACRCCSSSASPAAPRSVRLLRPPPSLADWFDMYGPTGCYCPDGSSRCSNGNCR